MLCSVSSGDAAARHRARPPEVPPAYKLGGCCWRRTTWRLSLSQQPHVSAGLRSRLCGARVEKSHRPVVFSGFRRVGLSGLWCATTLRRLRGAACSEEEDELGRVSLQQTQRQESTQTIKGKKCRGTEQGQVVIIFATILTFMLELWRALEIRSNSYINVAHC